MDNGQRKYRFVKRIMVGVQSMASLLSIEGEGSIMDGAEAFCVYSPPKYLTSNLCRCCTRFPLLLKALQSFFSFHPMPSSSNNCV